MTYFFVGIAGMIGALLRYYLGWLTEGWGGGLFPYGTFIANMAGSFILGWFMACFSSSKKLNPMLVTAIGTGLIGSFTTFSTFSVETVRLVKNGFVGIAVLYVAVSLIGGLLLSALGNKIGSRSSQLKEEERA